MIPYYNNIQPGLYKQAAFFFGKKQDDNNVPPLTMQEKEELVIILDNLRMTSPEYAEKHNIAWNTTPWGKEEKLHAAKSFLPAVGIGLATIGLGVLGAGVGTYLGRMGAAPLARKALGAIPAGFKSRPYLGNAARYIAGSGTLALGGMAGAGLAGLATDRIGESALNYGMTTSKNLYRQNTNNRLRDDAVKALDKRIHDEDVKIINKLVANKDSLLVKEITKCLRDKKVGSQALTKFFATLHLDRLPIK